MEVFKKLSSYQKQYHNCVATIGKFDGMHLGHQELLKSLMKDASQRNLPAVVILSEPQPEEFFSGNNAPPRLTLFHDKVDFLQNFGIDVVYCLHFDQALSQLSPEEFVDDILLKGLGVKSIIIGDDFRFGKNRLGDFALLDVIGQQKNFSVAAIDSFVLNHERVSSSLVRKALSAGDCEKTRQLLGRYFSISGEVVAGKKLGRELGSPTANINLLTERIPLQGVFVVTVSLVGDELNGVANIGYNPTIDANLSPVLEVYIFDFNKNIYGERISVSFLKKIREEKKFSNLDELKQHISMDIELAENFFKTKNAID